MRVLIIIPARSGSVRVPHKNVRPLLAGVIPNLLSLAVDAALEVSSSMQWCEVDTDVVVSTDCPAYAQHLMQPDLVTMLERPADLSGPAADIADAVHHALTAMELGNRCTYDWIVTLQPAVPLRNSAIIASMLDEAVRLHCVAAITGCRTVPWQWHWHQGRAVNDWSPEPYPRSQDLPGIGWQELNSVQIASRDVVLRRQRWDLPLLVHFLPPWAVLDIDTAEDFARAQKVLLPLLELLDHDHGDGSLVVSNLNGCTALPERMPA